MPESHPARPVTLGLTGGIGSGKSAAAAAFARHGARVFGADDVAKRLMATDDGLRRDLTAAFGDATFRADGSLDRARLASLVFGNAPGAAGRLSTLNGLVHPCVFAAWEAFVDDAAREGVQLVVHEAAILYESGGDAHVDAVVAVVAPRAVRAARAVARGGVTAAEVEARMAAQMDPAEVARRADAVLGNGGTLDDLDRQVAALVERFGGAR